MTLVTSATSIVFAVEMVRTASPATFVEEIPTPSSKRLRVSGKEREREKADSHPSTVWSDGGLAVDRAHGLVTAEDMKVLNGVPFNVVANQQTDPGLDRRAGPEWIQDRRVDLSIYGSPVRRS